MSLDIVIDFLLTRYAPFALWVAGGATVGLIVVPVIYLIVRGQVIRRSADGKARRTASVVWLIFSILVVPVATVSWAAVAGRWWVTRNNGVLDEQTSLQLVVITGFATALLYAGQVFWLRPRSPLAEGISVLTGGVRRRTDALGSAHFADPAEYRRFAQKHENGLTLIGEFRGESNRPNQYRILGDLFSLPPGDTARGVIAIGNPGSGKTQSIILPTLADGMRDGECLVVTDPQGELKQQVLDYARVTGHVVIIHDPTDPNSARFNLVSGIETVSNARALAEVLIPESQGGGNSDFFRGAARALLAACMIRYGSIGEIVQRLGMLNNLIGDLESVNDDAQFLAADFVDAARNAPKQAVGVTSTIMRALEAWADSTVRGSTATSDFEAKALVSSKRPMVVILSVPGRDRRALAPYLGATLTKLLLDLDTIGEGIPGGALPRPVKFILEEFPAMGNLSVIVEQANLVRKRRISFILACQTIGQLQNIYGRDGTSTLLAGMATQIIFGGADKETAQYFSSLAGNQTRKVERRAYPGAEASEQTVERPLLTHDQIISPPHAPQGNVIIFTRYVTESYAVNAVILARLTRMYERQDWAAAIAKTTSRQPRLFTRAAAEKRKRRPEKAKRRLRPDTDHPNGTQHQEGVEAATGYAFIRLRVIDDSAPPDQQNLVIPYGAEEKA